MARPARDLSGPAEVGRFYLVPCIKVKVGARTAWMPRSGWVPVLGPKHRDAEHLEFAYEHFHVDWRFIPDPQFTFVRRSATRQPHGTVITDTEGKWHYMEIAGEVVHRRLKCRRKMPEFPVVAKLTAGLPPGPYETDSPTRWARLERAQAFTCNKLRPGNICPHRGIDLTPFIKADGTRRCRAGHGLPLWRRRMNHNSTSGVEGKTNG